MKWKHIVLMKAMHNTITQTLKDLETATEELAVADTMSEVTQVYKKLENMLVLLNCEAGCYEELILRILSKKADKEMVKAGF